MAQLGTGCAPVLLIAQIRGPEDESWYCPAVEWTFPDGTRAFVESDCPPFEERNSCQPARGPECALDWHWESGSFVVDNNPCDCTVPGYPRRWTRNICAPPTLTLDPWVVMVRLLRDGRTIASDAIQVHVR